MESDLYWNRLVPELVVSDFAKSLDFYTRLLGFSIRFQRTDPDFVYLELDKVQFMLEAFIEDAWHTGELEKPYGRGINFQIDMDDIQSVYDRLKAADISLFRDVKETWYKTGEMMTGVCEFLVQDPDGYLLRFSKFLGEKPAET